MSEIKVNTITPRSGTTLTLGGSGDTVTLAACASQSGFGRTGTVDWCTTAKTSPFTAATGKGYFVNTCGGVVTVTLPASPSAGDIVALKDYKDTWDNNKVTVGRNSSKIFGECLDANLNTEGQTVTLVYVDGTQGWVNTQTDTTVQGNQYIQATGGNAVVTCGNYKTHIFTADGNFVVCSASPTAPNNVVDYLVVAGGGGGGRGGTPAYMGGGGGAGGFRYFSALSPAGSPLVAPAGITVSATTYPITVGAGGAAAPSDNNKGCNGANSVFSTITSAGGGLVRQVVVHLNQADLEDQVVVVHKDNQEEVEILLQSVQHKVKMAELVRLEIIMQEAEVVVLLVLVLQVHIQIQVVQEGQEVILLMDL